MEEPQRAESFRWLQKMGMPGAVNVKERINADRQSTRLIDSKDAVEALPGN